MKKLRNTVMKGVIPILLVLVMLYLADSVQANDDGYIDNSIVSAVNIDITGAVQERNFYSVDDVDWIKFYGVIGSYYNIETINLGSKADTVISVYQSDGTSLVSEQDDRGVGENETMSWQALESAVYYVKIRQYDSSVYGADTEYSLRTYLPSMLSDGKVIGTTTSSGGTALGGVFLSADSSLCNPVFSFDDGSYFMPCSAGSFTMTADLSGYETYSQDVIVTAEGITSQDFILTSSSGLMTAPILETFINGSTATAGWDEVQNSQGYTFYYAPYPYEGEQTIVSIEMGNQRSVSAELPSGAAYYAAATSWMNGVESEYSNIELIIMP